MNQAIMQRLEKTGMMQLFGKKDVFLAEPQYFGPLNQALSAAQRWLEEREAGYDEQIQH
jgi:hypothetical protein